MIAFEGRIFKIRHTRQNVGMQSSIGRCCAHHGGPTGTFTGRPPLRRAHVLTRWTGCPSARLGRSSKASCWPGG